jgi:hypothetical protein
MSNQQHGDYQVKTDNDGFNQNNVVGSHGGEIKKDLADQESKTLSLKEESQNPSMLQTGQGSIAYELLLLQQRLDAYEQLHIEEMAELREKIEILRRAFLQETNPQMRILTPSHNLYRDKEV